jgi:hypothetical protein
MNSIETSSGKKILSMYGLFCRTCGFGVMRLIFLLYESKSFLIVGVEQIVSPIPRH